MPVIKEGNKHSIIVLYLGLIWGLEHVILSCPETPRVKICTSEFSYIRGKMPLVEQSFRKKTFREKIPLVEKTIETKSIILFDHPPPKFNELFTWKSLLNKKEKNWLKCLS